MQVEVKFATREAECVDCRQVVEIGQLLVFGSGLFGSEAHHLLCLRWKLISEYEGLRAEKPAESRIKLDESYEQPLLPLVTEDEVYTASGMLLTLQAPAVWGMYEEDDGANLD